MVAFYKFCDISTYFNIYVLIYLIRPPLLRTNAHDKVSTLSCGPHLGVVPGGIKRSPTHFLVFGDGGSNHHPKHSINSLQVLTVQNEYALEPIVQSIRMGA